MIPVSQINTAADTWQDVIDRLNRLSDLMTSNVVTSDSSGGGSVTTGNVAVNGSFTSNVVAVSSSLRGGNASDSATLSISSPISVGNSTVNVSINSTALVTLGAIVNGSGVFVGANASMNSVAVRVGNSTVNAVINSVSVVLSGNATINSTHLRVGNSTVNSAMNSSTLSVGSNVVLNSTAVRVGNSTVNSVINSVSVVVGPESQLLTTGYWTGNSTANSYLSKTGLTVLGTSGNVVVGPGSMSMGNSTVNSIVNSTGFYVNGSVVGGPPTEADVRAALAALTVTAVFAKPIKFQLGTANTQTGFENYSWPDGVTRWATVMEAAAGLGWYAYAANGSVIDRMFYMGQDGSCFMPGSLTIGTVLSLSSSGITLASNISVTNTQIRVGNSTVNAVINSSSYYISGNPVAWRKASNSEVWSAAADRTLTTELIETASAFQTLTDAATVTVDWDTFAAGQLTLAGNRTLGAATNVQPGTQRIIMVKGSNSTSMTLSFDSSYKGVLPTSAVNSTSFLLLGLTAYNTTWVVVSSVVAS